MNLDKIFSDPALRDLRPEVKAEFGKLGRMVEGKSPMEVFGLITSFQKNLESRGLLNQKEKDVLSKAIENSLSPEEKRKIMGILNLLKKG